MPYSIGSMIARAASALLCLLAVAAFGQLPDRQPLADEWGYRPAGGAAVVLNPPSFSWVLEKEASFYTLQYSDNPAFTAPVTIPGLSWTVYTPGAPLKPGQWWWRYRITGNNGRESSWSRPRGFSVPDGAALFPQPTLDEIRKRISPRHPRLFLREEELPKLAQWAREGGKAEWEKLRAHADALLQSEPTPEPPVRASARDPQTRQFWWSNRVQTIKALQEAEILAFVWLITRESGYGEAARRFTLKLADWSPDGPTNFDLNCEAAKPMLHRLARAYDWAWPLFTGDERARIRAVLLRRAQDAWNSGEVRQGAGHLNQPYGSHANRTWHKLAENAIATFGETPEAEKFLQYAVTKFFAAYPVWSDDDGGWHEGLSYLGGYMSKAVWWMHIARNALGIDAFQKPFFARIGDYAMYSAPPGSPDLGLGDLAFRPPSGGWSFLHYYARRTGNAHWAWWLDQWGIPAGAGEPVLDFLWASALPVAPRPPAALPPSKVFRGTGVAILNSNLLDGAQNVQIRFKASPMGRWSHGHDPHNSFTLNAYGLALLVNNVYRDIYGSPFHRDWVWTTKAQNAVLVGGRGQKPHSADLGGRLLKWDLQEGMDFVAGDATASYEGLLTRARRYIFFLKPDVILIADDLAAPEPATLQWMLHGQARLGLDEPRQRLLLDRGGAGVVVEYAAPRPLKLRQWSGYEPAPDKQYLDSIGSPPIPNQWHVEADSGEALRSAFTVTVLRVFRRGQIPESHTLVDRSASSIGISAGRPHEFSAVFEPGRAHLRRNGRQWTIDYPE